MLLRNLEERSASGRDATAARMHRIEGSRGRRVRSEWFDRVGYTIDRAALRLEFPDVAFHDFESWAKAQDWSALLQGA
jgi:hypothetical protein